jgi:hypothetical protein
MHPFHCFIAYLITLKSLIMQIVIYPRLLVESKYVHKKFLTLVFRKKQILYPPTRTQMLVVIRMAIKDRKCA